ncbi:magnesium transporter [Pedomonas sp. V897]|uniref:magnesium transporter n=1 Tax=Pedomonas sp. V897 TaxID=3446482 RepID=UPI003EE0BFA5
MTEQPDIEIGPEDLAPREVLEGGRLRRDFIDDIIQAVSENDTGRVHALVEPLHPADVADLIEIVGADCRGRLVHMLGDRLDADTIAELNDWVRDEVIEVMGPTDLANVVTQLDTDDAVAIIEDLEAEQQEQVLSAMPAQDRAAIEEALTYPEDSAGRLMQRDLIAVPEYWTVGQLIDYLREKQDLATDFWEIFVVDPGYRPVGTIRLSWVLRSPRSVLVADLMQREQTLIPVNMDREELALRFQKYGLISAAVVDGAGRLVGMITVDDVVHIISEEAQEDVLKFAGAGEGDINEPVVSTVKTRVQWLVVNCGTAILGSLVIALFEASIEKLVALAILMPIVSSLGGNAGTQTMAVAVRALATGQLTAGNMARMVGREIKVALLNGLLLALLLGVLTTLYFKSVGLGLVIAAAMIINIIVAGLAGVLVPLAMHRIRIDPAVASSVFVTMTTDVMGFLAFLGLATAVGLANLQ